MELEFSGLLVTTEKYTFAERSNVEWWTELKNPRDFRGIRGTLSTTAFHTYFQHLAMACEQSGCLGVLFQAPLAQLWICPIRKTKLTFHLWILTFFMLLHKFNSTFYINAITLLTAPLFTQNFISVKIAHNNNQKYHFQKSLCSPTTCMKIYNFVVNKD